MNQQAITSRPGSEERAARARIDAAAKLLRGDKSNVPADFAALLFGRAAPEDLVGYDASELAVLAREAWAFLAARKPGTPKIRFEQPAQDGEHLKSVSVIEIVNDDMPFLVDSVMAELTERGLAPRLVVHPILAVARDKTGKLNGPPAEAGQGKDEARESFIHIHVARVDDAGRRAGIVHVLEQVLAEVRRCRCRLAADDPAHQRGDPGSQGQSAAGAGGRHRRSHPVSRMGGGRQFHLARRPRLHARRQGGPQAGAGERARRAARRRRPGADARRQGWSSITPQLRAFFDEPKTLIVTKANAKSRVHRRVYLDYIGVKRFDDDGNPSGEFRIVGLFTSTVYIRSIRSIPFLRRKVDAVLTRAGFNPETHSGKALVNVLETYPRDELFQIDEDTLYHFALSILQLEERPRVRVLARRDRFDRFVSVLV